MLKAKGALQNYHLGCAGFFNGKSSNVEYSMKNKRMYTICLIYVAKTEVCWL